MGKSGQVFMIPCNRAKDLSDRIEKEAPRDDLGLPTLEFRQLQRAMSDTTHGFTKGFFLISVAPEDYIMWPDGADIRNYQIVDPSVKFTIMTPQGVFSNQEESTQESRVDE